MTVQQPPVPLAPPASIVWAPSPASAHLDAQVRGPGVGQWAGCKREVAISRLRASNGLGSPIPCPTGLLCHMEDMCLSQPCHGEAQCSTNPLTGSTLCLCQPGYSGPTCHQDLDECQIGENPVSKPLQGPREIRQSLWHCRHKAATTNLV